MPCSLGHKRYIIPWKFPSVSPSLEDIVATLKNHPVFRQEESLQFAFLGGSFAKGTEGWWSDLDIFVYLDPHTPSTSKWAKLDLAIAISDLLRFEPVIVSVLNELPLMVQFEAIRKYVPLFVRDPEAFEDYVIKTWKLGADFRQFQLRWLNE
ncbi:MAG: nucleotidyltransferase domain-containing protein [Methanobacteriota archaeon]|nr:MAG: nucleotidyltransferase domain-containing protein [Euryarchaeota archaeon]